MSCALVKACRLLVRECRVAVCKKMSRRAQHFCEKNAEFPWTWCNLYCFKFRESSKCAAFFRNDKHSSESKRHPFTKISPVTYIYIYVCIYNYKYLHIHVYDVHICISYHTSYNYIYMRLFHGLLKKHNIPLINNVVALYAILPLREFWITILLWKSIIDYM